MADSTEIQQKHTGLPREPIDAVVDPLKRFLHIESASGIVLLLAALTALVLANSPLADAFNALWKTKLTIALGSFRMSHSLQHWINDGLMAIFFFVVGLEVKRELVMGELRDIRQAALPIAAALGGMIVPAAFYLLMQYGAPGEKGWGIVMATDIAFVVGCLAVLGRRIPLSLRVLLLSLAIADDIGAIVVIAIGYTESLNTTALALAVGGIALSLVMMKLGVRNVAAYIIVMILVWLGFHESGIHATISGVIFGLLTPAHSYISEGRLSTIVQKAGHIMKGGGWRMPHDRYAMLREMEIATRKSISPLERFETKLHPWVAFVIMPLFALANAGVRMDMSDFTNPVALSVIIGLFAGKSTGIILFSWIAVRSGLARLPEGVGWGAIAGGGFLAGIGFTMALFIASLALNDALLEAAKVGVMIGSFMSMIVGVLLLVWFLPTPGHDGS